MTRLALPALLALGGLLVPTASAQHAPPERLDCAELDCAAVLPGGETFEAVEGRPYFAGYAVVREDDEREDDDDDHADDHDDDHDGRRLVGWVVLSTDVVDIKAYSGKPLVTLVGLDPDGTIVGARVVHHSEPILLVGIPESALHEFVAFYVGKPAATRVVVGRASQEGALSVDVISGATVTALAQNRTILDSARALGASVGVVDVALLRPGHFVPEDPPWTWERMEREGVFGRLTVTEREMGYEDRDGVFVDLWFTIADAPQIGRALLGDNTYARRMEDLGEGDHLLVVLGNGSSSFKGSGFVRGGIFDRVRLEQGFTEVVFRDTDYWNLSPVQAEGAPRFKEGACFITRSGRIDPGGEVELVFLGSRYDRRSAYSRDFHEFRGAHTMPRSVYVYDGPDPNEPIWIQAWRNNLVQVIVLGSFLLFVMGVFALRRYTIATMARVQRLHIFSMTFAFVVLGVMMSAQPSITQVLTLFGSLVDEWRWSLFLSEPLIFITWIFIVIVSVVWGRGVFCGWVCPYGALTELLFKLRAKLGVRREYELPDAVHRWLRYLRYVLLAGLVPVFLWSSVLGEQLAEVEPFKSTFFVPAWTRHWGFFAWWAFLLAVSTVWWRPFCRYVCPLGAGLALLGSFRLSGPHRRNFCEKCTICTKGCEPKAIRPDGSIDPRECLSCMECEATYNDEQRCPPLVGLDRLTRKQRGQDLSERERERLDKLREDVRDVA